MTNADAIRSMPDDELLSFLQRMELKDIDYAKTFCDLCMKHAKESETTYDCDDCFSWWLTEIDSEEHPQGLLAKHF